MKALTICWLLLFTVFFLLVLPGMMLSCSRFEKAGEVVLTIGVILLSLGGLFALAMMFRTAVLSGLL